MLRFTRNGISIAILYSTIVMAYHSDEDNCTVVVTTHGKVKVDEPVEFIFENVNPLLYPETDFEMADDETSEDQPVE